MNAVTGSIDTLVAEMYRSHRGLADRAATLARSAEAAGDRRLADLAGLIGAELHNRGGRAPEGIAQARAVLAGTGDRIVVARAHAVMAGGLWRIGDNAQAVRNAYPASRMLQPGDSAVLRADHAIVLALQVNDQRIGAVSHREFRVAQELAEAARVPSLVLANLNNWAWCSYAHGDLRTAADLVDRMRSCCERTEEPLNASCADTVARILLETGQHAAARTVIEQAVAHAEATDSDAIPNALMTLADIQRREGNVGAALYTLQTCRDMAARDQLADVDAIALKMIAGCHAELGDYAAAYREMVDFHELWTVRRSERSEVMARVAHAQFAVDEAQRTTERFREMAERDALTGLWNRRRSDARLAEILRTPAAQRGPVCVALVDLDFFKAVNDSHTHAVGDIVLCRVAELLSAAGGHAGRHGGEEFILLFDAPADEAAGRCEAVRAAVEAYDWAAVAPGLTVTASFGLTPLHPDDTARSVVNRADEALYAAKHAGRNRVILG
ncbi:GGDEF domain-containing protein [Actinoplanes sp. N902-109]|uniref:GGDEF domain-containing protein n=1 Tax=Actinoplanes sp. (strain N902-109) TaxID=649831 RepID=UPI00032938FB|nr:GGDEF domain-containing protein [Actinoplanes sp. N902-109]AGL17661.1 diguanylate cyclase [Actinoplanes sp. N902-109]